MAYYGRIDRGQLLGGTRHDEALSNSRRSVPPSGRAELWRRSSSYHPKVHELHGGRHRSDPHLQGSYGPLSRHGDLLHHRRVHAGVAACGGDLGRVLRLLAGPGRILSLIVDGMPSPILLFYLAVELTVGTLGLLVLSRDRREGRVP